MLVAVVGVPWDGVWVFMVFAENAVPAVIFSHGFLPFGDVALERFDSPWMEYRAGFDWFVIDVDNVHDNTHVELSRAAFYGSEDFANVANPGHLTYSNSLVLR